MEIEPKVSHVQSKLGAIKPQEYLVWTYLIKNIYLWILYITVTEYNLFLSVLRIS